MSSYSNVIRLNRPESQDPIAVLEVIASENKWPLEKHAEDEVSFDCIGRWGELTMSFLWQEDCQALQICCYSDLQVHGGNRKAILDMLYEVNRKVWAGMFTLDDNEEYVIYRYTSMLRHLNSDTQSHIEDMMEIALAEVDRFYPAFQSISKPRQATDSNPLVANDMMVALLAEPMGEA
ncbi:MAG TPA: YbjN domain-containing protein [Alphaproteobacteria bacterium]